jgi:hypothetical protein
VRSLTGGWDRSVARLGASPDGRTLVVSADENGQHALFAVDPKSGTPRKLVSDGRRRVQRQPPTGCCSRTLALGTCGTCTRCPERRPAALPHLGEFKGAGRTTAERVRAVQFPATDETVHG